MQSVSWFDGFSLGSHERRDALGSVACELLSQPDVTLVVRNMSRAGFVVEASRPVRVGATHRVDLSFAGTKTQAVARAIESKYRPGLDGVPSYLVGFEFRRAGRERQLDRFLDAVLATVTPPSDARTRG